MNNVERYTILWQECDGKSSIAERFYVPGFIGYLPFFIWGDDLTNLENKQGIQLREEHLLKGILYGLYDSEKETFPFPPEKDRVTFYYLLEKFQDGFQFESTEQMILNTAGSIREINGNEPSRIVLEVGNEMVPRSSEIKSDLICDLWNVISSQGRCSLLFGEIPKLVYQVNLSTINPSAKEVICYYGLCALVFLKDEEGIGKYLPDYIYPNVENRLFKERIKTLLETPDKYDPIDLLIS
jgi:hypothetical protein